MDPNTKNLIFGLFLVILGISLFIMSVMDIRSYADSDNQTIKDNIDVINTCGYIIMVLSVFIFLMGIILIIRWKLGEFLEFLFGLSTRIYSFIMIAIGLLILIVGIVQRKKINNILPDMSDANAVKSYDDHHTIPASSVLGSNMGIIAIGISLVFVGIVYFFMNREEPVGKVITNKAQAEIQHEKNMRIVATKKKEWEDAVTAGTYSDNRLEELELVYENARATSEKAWSDYKKGIEKAISENTQAILGPTNVKASLSTPVSGVLTTQGMKAPTLGSGLSW